jgi:Ca2+/Na+ antiporter
MAAMWWFATIVLFLLLVTCIVFVVYSLKTAINTEDAVNVDPLPNAEKPDLEDKK